MEKLSLYDYLGRAAGQKLGNNVKQQADKEQVPVGWRKIENKKYVGNVLLYPKEFLDKYFQSHTKAIVVFSGGQDSTTCLYWALNRYKEVEAITFQYGQKHIVEIEQSKKILNKLGVKQVIVNLDQSLGFLAESALTSNGDVSQTNKYGLPSSFVPGRNGIFLYNAYVYALKTNADSLITGVCQTDYSGYPDCRRDFIDRLLETMDNGVFGDKKSNLKIETPLMYLTKSETFKLAEDEGCLPEVIEMSHTCYNGERKYKHEFGWSSEKGTSEDPFCPACQLRANGWEEYKKQYNK